MRIAPTAPLPPRSGGEGSPAVAKALAGLLTRPPKRSVGGSGVGGAFRKKGTPPTPAHFVRRPSPPLARARGGRGRKDENPAALLPAPAARRRLGDRGAA